MNKNQVETKEKFVGELNAEIIKLLEIDIDVKKIYIGETNESHIQKKHKFEYENYFKLLPIIIKEPDYVGIHPKQGGIEFIKKFDRYILVAVRATQKNILFVRSLYCITQEKVEQYLAKGTLKKVK